jgi:hypothetical protein
MGFLTTAVLCIVMIIERKPRSWITAVSLYIIVALPALELAGRTVPLMMWWYERTPEPWFSKQQHLTKILSVLHKDDVGELRRIKKQGVDVTTLVTWSGTSMLDVALVFRSEESALHILDAGGALFHPILDPWNRTHASASDQLLQKAVVAGCSKVVSYLLTRGADPNRSLSHLRPITPLTLALQAQDEKLVSQLLPHTEAFSYDDYTLAKELGHRDAVEKIARAGISQECWSTLFPDGGCRTCDASATGRNGKLSLAEEWLLRSNSKSPALTEAEAIELSRAIAASKHCLAGFTVYADLAPESSETLTPCDKRT